MEEVDKFEKRLRNIALLIIIIAVLLLTVWVILLVNLTDMASPLLMSISIALLLAGILLFTRIQYVIWMKKRY